MAEMNEMTEQRKIPGFGEAFTSHMMTMAWNADAGWHGLKLLPYGNLPMNPAMVTLHYGQAIFEGLKAHRQADGSIALFRPDKHALRFQLSAQRVAMPQLPADVFLEAVETMVRADGPELPDDPALSLYLRPFMFASEATLAVRPAREYLFAVIACVTGGFFGSQSKPLSVMVSHRYSRAAPGGTGAAKFAGNYAASYAAQLEAAEAGCQQVVWLDAVEYQWIEELGATNIFFVRGHGQGARVLTPELTGTLLSGVTRDSILTLAAELGYLPSEERLSVDQWREQSRSGVITESFACGTAAVVTPIGHVRDPGGDWTIGDGTPGPVTLALHDALVSVHRGRAADRHHWMHKVC
ncbi:MAG TPA: branched-chain amino acid aminotransferase [Streptosporangiaceae bacterium]|nr:branched-chain amino acid aminotransferase [Streptosporangiaceae bacterium]